MTESNYYSRELMWQDSLDKSTFARLFTEKLEMYRGVPVQEATAEDAYVVLAAITKERAARMGLHANRTNQQQQKKQVYYFSIEFLLGRMLAQNLMAFGLLEVCQEAMRELGLDLEKICEVELDPGLGNGGLGRLAACFMDSLAFCGYAGHGCSIRYKHGLFEQKIVDGNQIEMADNWLRVDNVWEIRKPSKAVMVRFGGSIREEVVMGRKIFHHDNPEQVLAMPYDIPMVGGANGVVNNLRLWSAESVQLFNFEAFSSGDYISAISDKYAAEAISEILYPDDSNYSNRLLRLKQQYFFVSAGVQSIIRHYRKYYGDLTKLPDYVSIHINDTHPAVAVPELMRILMDEEGLGWDEAWDLTIRTISYTNHTIMPEALERWDVETFRTLLPRIYMIVQEINERFCRELWLHYPEQWDHIARMAIIGDNQIRMAFLAIVGSHSINGVAQVHSDILKAELFKDFYAIYPERFQNMTNGVTQRRWLQKANPCLTDLISSAIGTGWMKEPLQLVRLKEEGLVHDAAFLEDLLKIKRGSKEKLAKIFLANKGIVVDPTSIFDVQVKRFHAYKRQLLLALYILELYRQIKEGTQEIIAPRTFIFGGKAAPGYRFAKETIRFISSIAEMINHDSSINNLIKIVFVENYRVSLAEDIFPASDVSEQISTASREASGTGNMKFMFNGAITIGTMDGANIEIFEAVGEGNYVRFGLTVPEVLALYRDQTYNSREIYETDPRVQYLLDTYVNTQPYEVGKAEFPHIYDSLISFGDEFLVLKDFAGYVDAQGEINRLYQNTARWEQMSAMNIASAGRFSSDEVIRRYARNIWFLE
ncbi:MAG: glycogen/starch/alpha-glucan phosphorylase [Symbiobacteriaceae bacterium]|nr:glycogen/starch/alpha-glucan phosphorylase [Symbiobacteriaceae bacterium]